MVDVLKTKTFTPQQALLSAMEEHLDDMECVAVLWLRKDDSDKPYFTCSNMRPVDAHFLGAALQHYALSQMT